MISDNASTDDTAAVVESYGDPRIVYRPLEHDIGRVANSNRLIGLAETEFLVLLGDDDALRPDHLARALEAFGRFPSAGVVHTGCSIVATDGTPLVADMRILRTRRPYHFETGAGFRRRSMRSSWPVCFPSAMFRRVALTHAGGLRPDDGVVDDLPLVMRISCEWDFVYVNEPLAVIRAHAGASSSSLGSFSAAGYQWASDVPDLLRHHRRAFLAEAALPESERSRLARAAGRTYRRDRLCTLSMQASGGEGMISSLRALAREVGRDRRLLLEPLAWRFVAGQLGGRRVRSVGYRTTAWIRGR